MMVAWIEDLPDSKYLEGTVGKMSWWMECEVGNKQR
jgi:hypothetical protein